MQPILVKQVLAIFIASQVTQICTFRFDLTENLHAESAAQLKITGDSHTIMDQQNSTESLASTLVTDVAVDVDAVDLQQDGHSPESKRVSVDANAFKHQYLIGFSMIMTAMGRMKFEKGPSGTQWNKLQIEDEGGVHTWFTGELARVTRPEVVPHSSSGKPAEYFAYVRFFTTTDGKVLNSGKYRFGGFVYFESQEHVRKGETMPDFIDGQFRPAMNILYKSDAGTMRFKPGFKTFWQLRTPEGNMVNFPVDVSKELSQRHDQIRKVRQDTSEKFVIGIPKVISHPWLFGKSYDDPAPAATMFTCQFKKVDKGLGSCSTDETGETELLIRVASNSKGPLPSAGSPSDDPITKGAGASAWWPITAEDFKAAGATHYTWVMPGGIGNGGFLYHMSKPDSKAKGGYKTWFLFFEMLHTLCSQPKGDTAYDAWMKGPKGHLQSRQYSQMKTLANKVKEKRTLIFVIDMQNDFVGGNFQMPCLRKREELTGELNDFLGRQFKKGATIIASLDYHPKGHCGLTGDCSNMLGPFKEYSTYNGMEEDEGFYKGKDKKKGRYVNRFPPHCEWIEGSNGRSVPQEGAKYYPTITRRLHGMAKKDPFRVHTVFKGFHPKFDSFSALATFGNATKESKEHGTGGYAVSDHATEYRPWPVACYDIPKKAHKNDWCYPTVAQLNDPDQANNGMWSVESVVEQLQLAEHGGEFERIIVTGLVFDFCVKETAFNAQKLFPGKEIIVPIELSRPACEGGEVPDFAYPPAGLGTAGIIERTAKEYDARNIRLVSKEDI